ncbi:MAG: UDP-N-acetylmuramate dehydrogenase [Clostridia bacterium]|nr:UDP-N-acetylmuramate dehydrogenase [Clostridia bacterium]
MRPRIEEVLKEQRINFILNAKTDMLSTFRIGGTCDILVEPCCLNELITAVMICERVGVPYTVIGRGSNILFPDGHLERVLIRTSRLTGVRREGSAFIVDCGVSLPRLSRLAASLGFSDLAFACGIPGTVGGGVFMNAGAHGKSLGELVKWVKVLCPETGKIKTIFNEELSFSYRNSAFQQNNHIILQVCLSLFEAQDPDAVAAKIKANLLQRSATQPLSFPSAGSVFRRRSEGEPLGRIIDDLGLKGIRCGGAVVSEKHAGFIVNLGDAKAEDVKTLIAIIKGIVKRKKGFEPDVEIKIL